MIQLDMSKVKKICMESNKEIRTYRRFIDVILDELEHPEALVTDKSSIWDFIGLMDGKRKKEVLDRMSNRFGFEITQFILIVDIAKKMRKSEQ